MKEEDEGLGWRINIQVISNTLQIFLLFLISLILWPLVAPLILVNEVIRWILFWILLPNRYERITDSSGGAYLNHHVNGRMIVWALYTTCGEKDEEIDVYAERERFIDGVFKKIDPNGGAIYGNLLKTFVQKWGYTCFRNDEESFDIANHVKCFDDCLPRDGNIFTEKELSEVLLPHYLSKDMDESKPQWEWLIIPKIRREDGSLNSLRLFRWDHRYMDGACAGILVTECLFDPWPGRDGHPPYVVNPRVLPSSLNALQRFQLACAWPWAWFNLPAILLVAVIIRLIGGKRVKGGAPFVSWDNKGLRSYSMTHVLDLEVIRRIRKDNKGRNCSIQSILATPLGSAIASSWRKIHPHPALTVKTVDVAGVQAVLPYKSLLVNQVSPTCSRIPLSEDYRRAPRFDTLVLPHFFIVCQRFIGRLPNPCLNIFVGPAQTTVILNNVPLLRETGSILGSPITQIATWNSLYAPMGLSIVAAGYGEKLFLTAFSVDDCCSHAQLEDFVTDYISRLKKLSFEDKVAVERKNTACSA